MALNTNDSVSWIAEVNDFADYKLEDLNILAGTLLDDNGTSADAPPPSPSRRLLAALPPNFDARTKWPNYTHAIRNQQSCGSCWAFGAAEALSDRFAIASAGKVNIVLSVEELVSCDRSNMGCQGGYLNT